MDNQSLLRIRNRLAALPVLEKRLKSLQDRISQARADVESLLSGYEKEAMDVDRIKRESFSSTLLKVLGMYEGRLEKEMKEMIRAKARYDAAVVKLNELESEAADIEAEIAELTRDRHLYREELERREAMIRSSTGEISRNYSMLCEKADNLRRQLTETEEALGVAKRAYETARTALEYLGDAESWATFDVWFSDGIISHMAKYDKIDKAQEAFGRLNAQIEELRMELKDIDPEFGIPPFAIDSATRFFDFWLDNIFTDMRVRNYIRDYQNYAKNICDRISDIMDRLEAVRRNLKEAIRETEEKQEETIISFGEEQ